MLGVCDQEEGVIKSSSTQGELDLPEEAEHKER